jgi:hypothetical protein
MTFKPGWKGGPGRPKRATEKKYLETMSGAVSLKDWKEITKRAVEDAKVGDGAARAWLSRHLVGDEPFLLADLLRKLAELEAAVREAAHGHEQTSADRNSQPGGEVERAYTLPLAPDEEQPRSSG